MTFLKDEIQARVEQYDHWATRRRYGPDGPNNRKLWVLACMDERLPVDEALGIRVDTPAGGGDAHCFRNAGGIVTDDAIRSAMLTCNFFGTLELIGTASRANRRRPSGRRSRKQEDDRHATLRLPLRTLRHDLRGAPCTCRPGARLP